MSATRNVDALSNQQDGGSGEFHARVERDEPLTTSGVSSFFDSYPSMLTSAKA